MEFHRDMPELDLEVLHQVALDSQITLQAFAERLEFILVDPAFHPLTHLPIAM